MLKIPKQMCAFGLWRDEEEFETDSMLIPCFTVTSQFTLQLAFSNKPLKFFPVIYH